MPSRNPIFDRLVERYTATNSDGWKHLSARNFPFANGVGPDPRAALTYRYHDPAGTYRDEFGNPHRPAIPNTYTDHNGVIHTHTGTDDFPCCTRPAGHFVEHADGTIDAHLHDDTDPSVPAKRDPWWTHRHDRGADRWLDGNNRPDA